MLHHRRSTTPGPSDRLYRISRPPPPQRNSRRYSRNLPHASSGTHVMPGAIPSRSTLHTTPRLPDPPYTPETHAPRRPTSLHPPDRPPTQRGVAHVFRTIGAETVPSGTFHSGLRDSRKTLLPFSQPRTVHAWTDSLFVLHLAFVLNMYIYRSLPS